MIQYEDFDTKNDDSLTSSIRSSLQSLLSDRISTIEETPRDNSKNLLINGKVGIKIFSQFSQTEVAIVSRNYRSESSVPTVYIGNNLHSRHYDKWRHVQSKYGGQNSTSPCLFATLSTDDSQKEVSRTPSLGQEYNKLLFRMFILAMISVLVFISWYLITVGAPTVPAPYW